MNGNNLDIRKIQIERLKEIFPEAFSEGKIDWEKLQATLGEDISFTNERYVLNWAGKSDAFRAIQTPTTATLVPDKDESVDFDSTENVFIEGENLEVLKVLQRSYYGKVKMIYIDPPYNTGSDSFIYPDKFSETKEEYLRRIGEKDENGYMTREGFFRKNSKDNGQYHSNWLSMMYPRLFLAKNLLKDSGVIFVSIDDNEVHNLRLLMNEIFGEENFIDQIIWKKSYGGGSKTKYIVGLHEYILCYAKAKEQITVLDLPPNPETRKYYTCKDEKFDTRGPYRTQPLATTSMDERPNLRFPIIWEGQEIWPEKQWQWSEERVKKALEDNELIISSQSGKWSVRYKQYLYDKNGDERSSKLFSLLDGPFTQVGTQEIKDFLGEGKIFAFPKPSELIKHLVSTTWDDKNALILDFFAGSCPTAQAVLEFNQVDQGNRKFICIQLPEKTDEESEAYKAGYKTIAAIGKIRIRRVIKKIEEEKKSKPDLFASENKELDIGFKTFNLRSSNFKIWRGKIETEEELVKQLDAFQDPVTPEAKEENMVYELMLKTGLPLTSKVETRKLHEHLVYFIESGELALALSGIDAEATKELIKCKPKKVIALDRLFKNNDQLKTNTTLQMKDAGIDFKSI